MRDLEFQHTHTHAISYFLISCLFLCVSFAFPNDHPCSLSLFVWIHSGRWVVGNIAAGVGIAVAGFAAGIGMVAFAEAQVS